MRFTISMCLLLIACAAFAANVTVGCPGGTPGDYPSITAALAALDPQGPHTITVTGTCTENILINQRERLTIEAPAGQTATIVAAGPFVSALEARHSLGLTLRNLIVRSNRSSIALFNNSTATITAVTVENTTGVALDLVGADVTVGGFNAADAVTVRGGLRCVACSAFIAGWTTVENSTLSGLSVDAGRVNIFGQRPAPTPPSGPNVFRNNFNGIVVTNGGAVMMDNINRVENNTASGMLLLGGHATVNNGTTFESNQRNAVSVLEGSQFRSNGANRFLNNGAAGVDFRAGISATHSSVVALTGGEISGSNGPGISADSASTVRLNGTSITGNSEEGIRLRHGAVFESIAGNNVPVNGTASVTCDATAIVFGDFTGIAPFECEKKVK